MKQRSLVTYALVALGVGLVAVFLAPLLPAQWQGLGVVVTVFLMIYAPLTPFALRVRIGNPVLRIFFGLTAVPVFMVIFVWMLHHLFTAFPALESSFAASWARGGRHAGAAHAATIIAPSVVAFLAWYAVVRLADAGIRRLDGAKQNAAAAGLLVVLAGAGAFLASPWAVPEPSAEWMTGAQLEQAHAAARSAYFPSRIEGRCEGAVEKYRAEWKRAEGRQHYFWFGAGKAAYDSQDRNLRAKGYRLESVTQFRGCAGHELFQGSWTR